MILAISNKSATQQPFHWNYSTEMKSIAREVSTLISLLGSISETHQSHFRNYVLLNTHTRATVGTTRYSSNRRGKFRLTCTAECLLFSPFSFHIISRLLVRILSFSYILVLVLYVPLLSPPTFISDFITKRTPAL
jgi:hypothetical protein